MAFSTCVVSGTLKDLSGTALSGYSVYAYTTVPILHSDGTLIAPFRISTTTASDGTWSLTVPETTTISRSIIFAFDLPSGTSERLRKEYTATIPNSATANFATLVSGQI